MLDPLQIRLCAIITVPVWLSELFQYTTCTSLSTCVSHEHSLLHVLLGAACAENGPEAKLFPFGFSLIYPRPLLSICKRKKGSWTQPGTTSTAPHPLTQPLLISIYTLPHALERPVFLLVSDHDESPDLLLVPVERPERGGRGGTAACLDGDSHLQDLTQVIIDNHSNNIQTWQYKLRPSFLWINISGIRTLNISGIRTLFTRIYVMCMMCIIYLTLSTIQ